MSEEEAPEEYEVIEEEVLAGEVGDVLKKERRSIRQHEGGLQKTIVKSSFTSACGHLIHSADEVGGRCQHKNCDALVCRDRLKACKRCMKLLCPKHQKLHKGMILCPTCKIIALLLGLSPSNTQQQNEPQRNPIPSLLFSYPVYQKWRSAPYDVVTPDERQFHRERRESYG
ncbi:MAG: hypothetical protein ACUVTD_02460 [Nitrososphaerales archaeon]